MGGCSGGDDVWSDRPVCVQRLSSGASATSLLQSHRGGGGLGDPARCRHRWSRRDGYGVVERAQVGSFATPLVAAGRRREGVVGIDSSDPRWYQHVSPSLALGRRLRNPADGGCSPVHYRRFTPRSPRCPQGGERCAAMRTVEMILRIGTGVGLGYCDRVGAPKSGPYVRTAHQGSGRGGRYVVRAVVCGRVQLRYHGSDARGRAGELFEAGTVGHQCSLADPGIRGRSRHGPTYDLFQTNNAATAFVVLSTAAVVTRHAPIQGGPR
ncbi:MAG: hypothetical protein QOF25_2265 [Mycobacterium sp.]|nr:hypothetical protein [Mycobacterium sp.]